jgi:hypothetical protein
MTIWSARAVDARLTGRTARSYRGGAFHRPRAREEEAGRVDCWRSPGGRLERCREDGSRTGLAGVLFPGAGCQLDSPAGALVRPATPGLPVRGRDTSHRRPCADPCCRCLGLFHDVEQASLVDQVEFWFTKIERDPSVSSNGGILRILGSAWSLDGVPRNTLAD